MVFEGSLAWSGQQSEILRDDGWATTFRAKAGSMLERQKTLLQCLSRGACGSRGPNDPTYASTQVVILPLKTALTE